MLLNIRIPFCNYFFGKLIIVVRDQLDGFEESGEDL